MLSSELISVVVTTYNRSDALVQVLKALSRQIEGGFEVIIADDGSTKTHQLEVCTAARESGLPIVHVWHPDVGFTASKVRNLGVSVARGQYVVFLDGDCIPELDFIKSHRMLMQAGHFVNGSRVFLSQSCSEDILTENTQVYGRGVGYWLRKWWAGDASKLAGLLRLPDLAWRRSSKFKWRGIRSCNLGVWRQDFESINGFDESFVGWGHEDADFVLRLHNLGLVRKDGFCATEVYHLWHPDADRSLASFNARKVQDHMREGVIRAEVGYLQSMDDCEKVVTRINDVSSDV
jgi:glycosyltransferase involved in cell wall biosynthesis